MNEQFIIQVGRKRMGIVEKELYLYWKCFILVKKILARNDTMLPISGSLVFVFIYFFNLKLINTKRFKKYKVLFANKSRWQNSTATTNNNDNELHRK